MDGSEKMKPEGPDGPCFGPDGKRDMPPCPFWDNCRVRRGEQEPCKYRKHHKLPPYDER